MLIKKTGTMARNKYIFVNQQVAKYLHALDKTTWSFREVVAGIMSRNRWEKITSKFYMVDNTTLDLSKPDNFLKFEQWWIIFEQNSKRFQ